MTQRRISLHKSEDETARDCTVCRRTFDIGRNEWHARSTRPSNDPDEFHPIEGLLCHTCLGRLEPRVAEALEVLNAGRSLELARV